MAPEVSQVRIVRRTTHYDRGTIRPQLYAFSEVLITAAGQHYLSRVWHEIPDTPFNRADQATQFRKRWEAAERAANGG
jgi:hypothetical protein